MFTFSKSNLLILFLTFLNFNLLTVKESKAALGSFTFCDRGSNLVLNDATINFSAQAKGQEKFIVGDLFAPENQRCEQVRNDVKDLLEQEGFIVKNNGDNGLSITGQKVLTEKFDIVRIDAGYKGGRVNLIRMDGNVKKDKVMPGEICNILNLSIYTIKNE